jgi:hypothetical protein
MVKKSFRLCWKAELGRGGRIDHWKVWPAKNNSMEDHEFVQTKKVQNRQKLEMESNKIHMK